MSNVQLRIGERYNFASLAGQPVVLDATDDHNRDIKYIRALTEITGTLRVSNNIYAHGDIYGDTGTNVYDLNYVYLDRIYGDGDTNTSIRFPGSDHIDFYTGGAFEMRLEGNGDLHVDGDVIAFSTTTSDIRLKTNIQPLAGSLDIICKLEGVKFDWKYRDEKDQIGLIAQEVEKQIPEAIKEAHLPFYASSSIEIDDEGKPTTIASKELYKTINYDMIVPHLIESIKTLKSEIDQLKIKLENK